MANGNTDDSNQGVTGASQPLCCVEGGSSPASAVGSPMSASGSCGFDSRRGSFEPNSTNYALDKFMEAFGAPSPPGADQMMLHHLDKRQVWVCMQLSVHREGSLYLLPCEEYYFAALTQSEGNALRGDRKTNSEYNANSGSRSNDHSAWATYRYKLLGLAARRYLRCLRESVLFCFLRICCTLVCTYKHVVAMQQMAMPRHFYH